MDILRQEAVTTRKSHHCWGCSRKFPAGSRMDVVVSADGGSVVRTYWCSVCEAVMAEVWDEYDGDGLGSGDLRVDNDTLWAEKQAEIEEQPESLAIEEVE